MCRNRGMMNMGVIFLILQDFQRGSLRDIAVDGGRTIWLFCQVVMVRCRTVIAALRLNGEIKLGKVQNPGVFIVGC